MMKTRKIREKMGTPRHSSVSSRVKVCLRLSSTALAGALTLSFALPALSGTPQAAPGQYLHPAGTVIISGNGTGNTEHTPRPTSTPAPAPPTASAGETGCCA